MLAASRLLRRPVSGAAMPALFVLLWSTGFIGAKLGALDAEPFTFLLLRFVLACLLLGAAAIATRAPWPTSWRQVGHIALAGLLAQGGYLGAVYESFRIGMPAGISALIVSMQPLLTGALAGPLLGEEVRGRQWLGLALGFAGVALVISRSVSLAGAGLEGVVLNVVGLVAITLGTIYQKRYCAALDLRTGVIIQYVASGLLMLALSLAFEHQRIDWTWPFVAALAWLVLVLSIGAVSLLYVLIRRGAASRVTSLLYLVPPITALLAYLLFGERLGPLSLLGMAIAVMGVALVNR
jgi:drug/metabolite transporter (DMT)-like permease